MDNSVETSEIGQHFLSAVSRLGRMRPPSSLTYPGLTPMETEALGAIAMTRKLGVPTRPGRIAKAMHITKGAFSQTLKSLEQGGFVVRSRAEEDSRAVEIALTETGEVVIDWLNEGRKKFFDEMVAAIGYDDLEHMTRTIERMLAFQEERGFEDIKERSDCPCD